MRLLLTWLQIHPAIGARREWGDNPVKPGRIQVGAAQAVDAEDFDTGRRWDPDTDLDRDQLDAAMADSPPRSVAEFLELIAGELQKETGYHVAVQDVRPEPEPTEPEPIAERGPENPDDPAGRA